MTRDRDNVFGPDRDRPEGIYPAPGTLPPQVTDVMVESAAMHSKSQGWLPAVVIRIATDDGAGIAASIQVGPELDEIIQNMRLAQQRARRDVATALAKGDLP